MTDNENLARWQGLYSYRCVVDGPDCGECVIDDPDHIISDCDVAPTISSKLECKYWVLSITEAPDYLNDDAAAMSLLDTLVEKGYWFTLDTGSERYMFNLRLGNFDIGGFVIEASGKTRREAVIAAVLELIEKEGV